MVEGGWWMVEQRQHHYIVRLAWECRLSSQSRAHPQLASSAEELGQPLANCFFHSSLAG